MSEEVEMIKVAKLIFTTYLSPHSPKEINLEVCYSNINKKDHIHNNLGQITQRVIGVIF